MAISLLCLCSLLVLTACAVSIHEGKADVEGGKKAASKLVWESLYPPPFTDLPATVIVALSCVDSTLCFIPGGANGVGFLVYKFDGKPNGNWEPMVVQDMMLMMLSITMGGNNVTFNGAVGGIGFLGKVYGMDYYNTTNYGFQKSSFPFELVSISQSIDSKVGGTHIVATDGGPTVGIFHSTDGGANFVHKPITGLPSLKSCSGPEFISMIDDQTWFLTLGQFPVNNSNSQISVSKDGTIRYRKHAALSVEYNPTTKQSKFVRHSYAEIRKFIEKRRVRDPNDCIGYAGEIAKTTDGGNTWTSLYLHNSSFDFSMISCFDAQHCVTAADGVLPDGTDVTYLFTTTDGVTFQKTLTILSSDAVMYYLYSVAHRSANEVWVAGGTITPEGEMDGLFYFSKDGGVTWVKYPVPEPEIGQVMDMSFVPSGDGFAAAVTEFDTSTILRYAEQPYYGYFTQMQCPFAGCYLFCQNATFPQGLCLPTQGGSMEAFCSPTALLVRNYQTTSCLGDYTNSSMPLDQCLQSDSGDYFVNFCSSSLGRNSQQVESAAVKRVLHI